jgi:hypothetical protein
LHVSDFTLDLQEDCDKSMAEGGAVHPMLGVAGDRRLLLMVLAEPGALPSALMYTATELVRAFSLGWAMYITAQAATTGSPASKMME